MPNENRIQAGSLFYDTDTKGLYTPSGTRVGEWTFNLVLKRWYNRFWTLIVGSPYESPLEFPTKESTDKYIAKLKEWFPKLKFTVVGNTIAPKSDNDRVMIWIEDPKGNLDGPFSIGRRMYDLWYRPDTVKVSIQDDELAFLEY